jgi:uncharacterized protein YdhG (YjbR/CyaY superfamily)
MFVMKQAKTASTATATFKTVNEYVAALPTTSKAAIKQLRQVIQEAAPDATEAISYNMPSFKYHGGLIWYAAWKEHISIYPRTKLMEEALPELENYEGNKGTIKFPLDKPLPLALIRKIVKCRIRENLSKVKPV